MKQLLILLLFCYSCTPDRSKEQTEYQTNIFLLQKLFNAQRSLDSVQTDNVVLLERLEHAKTNNYSLIQQTLNYKEAVIESKYVDLRLAEVLKEKEAIIKEGVALRKKNEELIKENEGIKYKLNNEIEQHGATKKQKIKLEKEVSYASSLNLASIRVMGVGYTLAVFGKPKAIETNVAKKIRSVMVSFTMPSNMLAVKEEKKVVVVMYSTDSKEDIRKDTTINYVGNECNVALYLKSKKEFSVGTHLINIVINSKLEAEREFNITK